MAQDLVGVHEIAELLGVSRQRVHQLAATPDFPTPVAELAAGDIWKREDIETWRTRMRPFRRVKDVVVPPRDPERPQDDPWDANAVRYLLDTPEGCTWTRGNLMECLREQGNRLAREPDRVRDAARLAEQHGVERRADPGGKTLHFFRSDRKAPRPYPSSAAERRAWLREAPARHSKR
jgi:predicted DNA-binding transcriptional regulator AlpA